MCFWNQNTVLAKITFLFLLPIRLEADQAILHSIEHLPVIFATTK